MPRRDRREHQRDRRRGRRRRPEREHHGITELEYPNRQSNADDNASAISNLTTFSVGSIDTTAADDTSVTNESNNVGVVRTLMSGKSSGGGEEIGVNVILPIHDNNNNNASPSSVRPIRTLVSGKSTGQKIFFDTMMMMMVNDNNNNKEGSTPTTAAAATTTANHNNKTSHDDDDDVKQQDDTSSVVDYNSFDQDEKANQHGYDNNNNNNNNDTADHAEKGRLRPSFGASYCCCRSSGGTRTRTRSTRGPPRKSTLRRFLWGFLLGAVPVMLLFVLVIAVGVAVERRRIGRAPRLEYDTTTVCATGPAANFTHYPTAQQAHDQGAFVAHCGPCGRCSTPHDLYLLSHDTNLLDVNIGVCSWSVLLVHGIDKCVRKRMGFTDPCHSCWSRFVQCSVRNCKFSCFKGRFAESETCAECRERFCSTELLECSGVDRKRLGFIDYTNHDNTNEICLQVDYWWQ